MRRRATSCLTQSRSLGAGADITGEILEELSVRGEVDE